MKKRSSKKRVGKKTKPTPSKNRPVGETSEVRERLKKHIGQPVSKLNPQTESIESLQDERKKIYAYRARLNTLLSQYSTKSAKRVIRNEIIKATRFLTSIKKRKGTYKRPVGFKKSVIDMTKVYKRPVIVQNVYKWDASKFIDRLLNKGAFKKYIVGGTEYKSKDVMNILSAIDELETEADFNDIYFFRIELDIEKKTVSVTILY